MLTQDSLLRVLAIVFLTTAMLSLGLQTTRPEIAQALRDRRLMRKALLANLVLVPALGTLVALLAPVGREVRLGIALLALAPGAPFGIQFMRMVKRSEAIAVGLALLLTTISLVYTPVMATFLLPLEAPVRLPYGRIVTALLLYLVLPLMAGLELHRRLPQVARRLAKPLFLLATVAFVTLMILSGDLKREGLAQIGASGIAAMLVTIAGAMAIGWWLGGPDPGSRQVLTVSTSMRNVVISHLIATQAFPTGNVDSVVLAFFALMVPANFLLTLGIAGYGKWQARHTLRVPPGSRPEGGGMVAEETPLSSDQLAQQRTDLALDRTVIAAERTLMAWVRTSLSMISFGFTLYKFFQYLREANQIAAARVHGPRHFGLMLIGLGTAALVVAAMQHRQYLARLGARSRQFTWSLAFVVAVLVALIGALTFFGMLLRVGPF